MTFRAEFEDSEMKHPSANTACASASASIVTPALTLAAAPAAASSAAPVKAESLTSELVKALHAATQDSKLGLYEYAIIPVLQDIIPRLPATSPRGQPLEWLDLRPLLESALEHTKHKVAHLLDQNDNPHSARLTFLQECIAKPPFVAAAPASSILPPASASSSLGSATSNANSKQRVDAAAESQDSAKSLTAEHSGAAVSAQSTPASSTAAAAHTSAASSPQT
jgi:hypothetical protein